MCGISTILTLQALGHVRLEINDLSVTGLQPLHSTDRKIHAVVNGELYDYEILRQEMEEKMDYKFCGTSDCELVLALYQYYGTAFLSKLRGEFALVLFDEDRQLFLAIRDRYGIKPLFWTIQNGQLLVAAEMKAFLPLGWKPEWDMRSIVDGGYQIGSATFFKNVQKVRPGHYLICRSYGAVEENIYWDMKYPDKNLREVRTEKEMIEGVRSHLYDAVKVRLRADVKVGVALSGGIDSSVVAGMICQMMKEGEAVGGEKVIDKLTCFGIAFDEDSGFDESAYANRTADFLGVKFHKKDMNEQALADRFEDATWICEQPCPDLNFIGCYALSELVREKGFRVLINGQGSDEIFGGYPLFLPEYLREPDNSFSQPILFDRQSAALHAESTISPYTPGPHHSRTLHQLNSSPSACRISSAYPTHPYPDSLLSTLPTPSPPLTYAEVLSAQTQSLINTTWHPLHTSLYLFCKSNLQNLLLCNLGDRGEMAHSIEGRTPFLDHHLTEYVNSLPPSVKIRPVISSSTIDNGNKESVTNSNHEQPNGHNPNKATNSNSNPSSPKPEFIEKWILREAARPYITDEIYKKRKHPYSAPVKWPRGGPLYAILKKLVTRERVEGLGWLEWGRVGGLLDRAFAAEGGDNAVNGEGGDKAAYGLLLMVAQWVVIGEKFGVEGWRAD